MTDRNWEAELAKIDKQLASVSDEQLLAESRAPANRKGGPPAALPAGKAPAAAVAPTRSAAPAGGTWRGWVKVTIAVAAAAGLMFWPWPARCGPPLMGFTAATGAVALLGLWSALGTWRHRLGLAHVASMLVVVWGLALGAREVLPRVGYAIPTDLRAAGWSCDLVPAGTLPAGGAPNGAPSATPSNPQTAPSADPTAAPVTSGATPTRL